jgi:hypothetical protein
LIDIILDFPGVFNTFCGIGKRKGGLFEAVRGFAVLPHREPHRRRILFRREKPRDENGAREGTEARVGDPQNDSDE